MSFRCTQAAGAATRSSGRANSKALVGSVLAAIVVASVSVSGARAAEPEPALTTPEATPAPTPAPTPELTPEERDAIEKALGAEATPAGTTSPAPSPAQAPTGGVFQSMNPDISVIFDGAASWFSKDEPEQLGGHDPRRTGFTFQQLEMHLGGNVDPFFKFDANIVFTEFGVEIEEAYVTTMALPGALQLRAGQFLARFGKRNPTHPHSWGFLDQPLALGKFMGSEGSRGLGFELSWLVPLPWYVELVASAQLSTGECCHRSFYGALDGGIHGPEDLLYTVALKQFFDLSDDWAMQWGLSAQLGPNATGNGNRTAIYGTDLFLRWKPVGHAGRTSVDLLVEFLLRSREVPSDVLVDWGLFAELRWQLDAEWAIGARQDTVSGVDADPIDPSWTGYRHRSALALDFMPSHFSRIRLQGGVDSKDWERTPGGFVMLGLEVGIGAHSSHGY